MQSFAKRNKLPKPIDTWFQLLEESNIEDYPTFENDMEVLENPRKKVVWAGESTIFFELELGKRVSGYLEGFGRLLKKYKVKTWIDLVPVIVKMRELPGLEDLVVPKVCNELLEERDEKRKKELEVEDDPKQCAGTPKDLFKVLHDEYKFDVDVCANADNFKLEPYMTIQDDSLKEDWSGLRVWCNSPYKDIPAWLEHSHEPDLVAYLLPVRSDREWWRKYKPLCECHYFVGERPHKRIQFEPPPGVTYSSNPDCHVLFIFGEEIEAGKEVWRSGKTGKRL
jgi:hypothetical protein